VGVNSLFDSNDLVKLIKKAAVEAVYASKPANMFFGKVISESPLKIKVDQKLILTEAQLVLSRDVTDYEIIVTLKKEYEWITENTQNYAPLPNTGVTACEAAHDHTVDHKHDIIQEKKKVFIHNALKNGEEVILMQIAGGQKYIVIDRIGKV
jgi:hypothetical protein